MAIRTKFGPGTRQWTVERIVAELRRIHKQGRIRMTAIALIDAGYTG